MKSAPWFVSAALLCATGAMAEAPGASAALEPMKTETPARTAQSLFDPAKHMRITEVKPGMKGYGVSVFSGTKLERFDVEVVSVLHNQMGPQQDVVLIKCRGQGLEHSGSVAGMSGSPIYLVDEQGRTRMIGAFALGWEFAKDPIAGVRPIEEMLRVPTDPAPKPAAAKVAVSTWDTRPLISGMLAPEMSESKNLNAFGDAIAARLGASSRPIAPANTALVPLSLPLTVSGVDASFVAQMAPLARAGRFTLLQAGGAGDAPAGANDAKLEPGAAIGVPIVTGDLDLAAIGTVTEVIGDRVFAFGHEFNAEGSVDLPMGVGYVHTVIANQSMSFKLGAVIRTDGTLTSDESVAVAGMIGAKPSMIPVEISVRSPQRSEPQVYKYQVVRHPRFTIMGSMMAIGAGVTGHSRLPQEFTIDYDLKMEFSNGESVSMKNRTTSLQQAMELVRDLQTPIMFAIDNPFQRIYPTKITGSFEVKDSLSASILRSASTPKAIYKPGETVKIHMVTRPWRGEDESTTLELKIPSDQPEGPAAITITDAQRYLMEEMRFAPHAFQANDLKDVFSLLRTLSANATNHVYVRLATPREGLSMGRTALEKMPSGKRKLLAGGTNPDVTAFPESVTQQYPTPQPLIGAAALQIIVSKHPEHAQRVPAPQGPAMPTPVQPPPAAIEDSGHE